MGEKDGFMRSGRGEERGESSRGWEIPLSVGERHQTSTTSHGSVRESPKYHVGTNSPPWVIGGAGDVTLSVGQVDSR